MTITPRIARPLGTMITYGYTENDARRDLALAMRMHVSHLEILPHWRKFPDPIALRSLVSDHGLSIHSAHGCWGSQSIDARRVDLASLDPQIRQASVEDIWRCLDWLAEASGTYLVVHPGGLSQIAEQGGRRSALLESLQSLVDHARAARITLCVENMPPGVHPGSRMADLASIVAEINRAEVKLALDTGHAHLSLSVNEETQAAGPSLMTTHVHDNHGKQDVHLPPGFGSVDWPSWVQTLDAIGYQGPIMLECIRYLRDNPDSLTPAFLKLLDEITGNAQSS